MVLKRKLDYGPNSIGFSVIPRGPRSARRKISHKDDIEDNGICAFELLAAVAGKLLQESESSASSNVAIEKDPFLEKLFQVRENSFGKGKLEVDKTPECPDRGSCVESSSRSELPAKKTNSKIISRKFQNESDTVLETGSIISACNVFNKDGDKVKFEIPDMKDCVKNGTGSPTCGESSSGYVDNSIETKLESKGGGKFDHYADLVGTNTSNDKLKINVNYYPLIKTDSSVKLASFRDSLPNDSFLSRRNNVNVSIRDDDENFIRCSQCKPKIRAFRPRSCIGYRRVRKLSPSKYWKVAPKLKDCDFSNSERGMKRIFYNRKYCHTSERIRREGSFKKRKLFDGSPKHASDREGSSESISNTREKGIKGEKIGALKSRKELGISSPFVGQGSPYKSMDSHVKFSIKSFKVPELYIEVPETATVGSLKRTVMEAVTAILQEGLRVGVILQGEKVKDDERTLLQSGISHNGNLDNLGFSLEPTPIIVPPLVSPEVPITLLPCETAQPLTSLSMDRFVADSVLELGKTSASADPIQVADTETNIISNNELVPFNTEIVTNEEVPDSRALVPLPEASIEALSIILTTQKTKKTEMAQRRTRRPFSVTEVEALVEAVETLGTGRWRDVKLRAFESADHRTYVDLKDKWKTLVHTASISPQQRRGQPVPQDLLDRVLGAHSYWSQHQSKQQHNKNQAELATA